MKTLEQIIDQAQEFEAAYKHGSIVVYCRDDVERIAKEYADTVARLALLWAAKRELTEDPFGYGFHMMFNDEGKPETIIAEQHLMDTFKQRFKL